MRLDEQHRVVGPTIDKAVKEFDWKLIRYIALKPRVRFAYFPVGARLRFRNFAEREERIDCGEQAFDIAAAVGWHNVELALQQYNALPSVFFADPVKYFADFRTTYLATA